MSAETYIRLGLTVEQLLERRNELAEEFLALEHEISSWSSGQNSDTRESLTIRKRELERSIADLAEALSILDPDNYGSLSDLPSHASASLQGC
ncbi:MAG: hypothetical protein ABQ298_03715 [Puniceicoccaceae bacterium]